MVILLDDHYVAWHGEGATRDEARSAALDHAEAALAVIREMTANDLDIAEFYGVCTDGSFWNLSPETGEITGQRYL